MSRSEALLWTYLRRDALGYRFRRQASIGGYYLDFYCPAALLAVEVDGEQHGDRVELDTARDKRMSELGILTLRFPSYHLWQDGGLSHVLEEIRGVCEARVSCSRSPEE